MLHLNLGGKTDNVNFALKINIYQKYRFKLIVLEEIVIWLHHSEMFF